jgi:hypothetical protein
MGILIDAKGQIASEVAAGAQAVFELAVNPHVYDTAAVE